MTEGPGARDTSHVSGLEEQESRAVLDWVDENVALVRRSVFGQIIPEARRRQFKQALDAYEAARRDPARAGGDRAAGEDAAATAE